MEKKASDLSGMAPLAAKEYIFGFISTLKLTEKKRQELDTALTKWNSRIELAKTKGASDLALEAEQEAERIKNQQQQLTIEISELQAQIAEMRKQLPLLGARERSIDPDLLEQELLMALGYLPGEQEKACNDRLFNDLEKENAADAALAELKAKFEKE